MTIARPILAFPTPFPGEFFGGILLRFHQLYGCGQLSYTLCTTLELGRGAIRNLPTKLKYVATKAIHVWPGGIEEILENHTVWPVYRPFLTRHAAFKAYKRIVDGPTGGLQLILGDAPARLKFRGQLQVCPVCLAEDNLHFGCGYFHTDHQLPGVRACHRHRVGLIAVQNPSESGQNGFQIAEPAHPVVHQESSIGEVEFAILAEALRTANVPRLTPRLLALAYGERLQALGLLTKAGSLRSRALAQMVTDRYSLRMLSRFGISQNTVETWMPRMLHRLQCGNHPVKHLLFIGTLFGGVGNFLETLPQRELPFERSQPPPVKRDIETEVAIELGRGPNSMASIAKRLNISINTCITYAKRAGVKVDLRPKRIDEGFVQRIARKVASGAPITGICRSEHVSASTVYRTIKSNKVIEQSREAALMKELKKQHRVKWIKQVRSSAAKASGARRHVPGTYAWLYRHDRNWLMRNTRTFHRVPTNLHSSLV